MKVPEEAGSDVAGSSTDGQAGTVTEKQQQQPPEKWPDKWREMYAGEDEKKLQRLSRYQSPVSAFDALFAAQQKISSGELKTVLPDNATPEQTTKWREENGIPDSPEKYDLTGLKNGLVVGEEDKPFIDDFMKIAHESNLHPKQVKAAVEWYYDNLEKVSEQQSANDNAHKQEAEDSLRSEWGNDYRRNINLVHGLLDTGPEGLKDRILSARMPDGKALFNDAETLKWMTDLALQINPVSTLVPGAHGNVASMIEDEVAQIEKTMREDRTKYNRDEKMQERYRQLIDAR